MEAGDIGQPFVPNGSGAPKTFTEWEHLHWGAAMTHELETNWGADIPDDLQSAIDFETQCCPEVVD